MQGLRTIIYVVGDLKEAKEWYAKAFKTQPYFNEPYYVGFNIGGYELGLQPEEKKFEEKTENVISYWGVEDIKKSYQDLLDLGATAYEKPTNVGGDIEVAMVKDPWENVIGIIYNPNFKIED